MRRFGIPAHAHRRCDQVRERPAVHKVLPPQVVRFASGIASVSAALRVAAHSQGMFKVIGARGTKFTWANSLTVIRRWSQATPDLGRFQCWHW